MNDTSAAIVEACKRNCSSDYLSGDVLDRCAIWHQILSLNPLQKPALSCEDFIERTVLCPERSIANLRVACDITGRVRELVGTPEAVKDVEEGSCVVHWAGELSPALKVMDHLKILQLNVPPRNVSVRDDDRTEPLLPFQMFTAQCKSLLWVGENISGTIPPEWGTLRAELVDLKGNGGLKGLVPVMWAKSGTRVRIKDTQLHSSAVDCELDCFDPSLTGERRDKCGLWHQLHSFDTGMYWLPPCEEYVLSDDHEVCGGWEHNVNVTCDREGRIANLLAVKYMEDAIGQAILPLQEEAAVPPCSVSSGSGKLVRQLAALDHLRVVDVASSVHLARCQQFLSPGVNISEESLQTTVHVPRDSGGNITLGPFNRGGGHYGHFRDQGAVIHQLPPGWATTANTLLVNGVLISPATFQNCSLNCFQLSGQQRDKCGVWQQLNRLEYHPHWLLPCDDYVWGPWDLCGDDEDLLLLSIICNKEGRVTDLNFRPYVQSNNISLSPQGSADQVHDLCQVVFQGTLAPEIAALEELKTLQVTVSGVPDQYNCRRTEWYGNNITGGIPEVWSELSPHRVDLRGNQMLGWDVPLSWVDTAVVRVAGTSLDKEVKSCSINCFDQTLTGQQRDKCGVWYQMNSMLYREHWLPACRDFILGKRAICNVSDQSSGVVVGCTEDRVTSMRLLPLVSEYNDGTPGSCLMQFEGHLAHEIGALDMLTTFIARVPPWGAEEGPKGWSNCTKVHWQGANLTGKIPDDVQFLEGAQNLRVLDLMGNSEMGDYGRPQDLPERFYEMRADSSTVVMLRGTSVRLPHFSAARKHSLCKFSQRKNSSLEIWGPDDQVFVFSTKMDRDQVHPDRFPVSTTSMQITPMNEEDVFYCGKNSLASIQAVVLWSTFLLMVVGIAVSRAIHWRRTKGQGQQAGLVQDRGQERHPPVRPFTVRWQSWKTMWGAPFLVALSVVDLITDVLLAVSMYPSWTTWPVLIGFTLPSVICAVTIILPGLPLHQRSVRCPLAYLRAMMLVPLVTCVFPLLVMVLILNHQLGPRHQMRPALLQLNVDRLAKLFSGLTACTEDILVSIFATVGYVLMAVPPWQIHKSDVYFVAWAFWLSVITSMCHLLISWWEAVGHFLEHPGHLGCLREDFRQLYTEGGEGVIADHMEEGHAKGGGASGEPRNHGALRSGPLHLAGG